MNPQLAEDLRPHGFRVTYPQELGTARAADEQHLIWAAENGYCTLTFNVKDFPLLGRRWVVEGREHAGIILSVAPPPISSGEAVRGLLTFLNEVTAEGMVNHVRWLSDV